MAKDNGLSNVFIHAFTDGRDTDPHSGISFIKNLQKHISKSSPSLSGEGARGGEVKIASVVGRYYAMDRDKRWERIKLAYDMLLKGEGVKTTNVMDAIKASYNAGITDE